MMLFHHSRELAHVRHGPVGPGGDPADELEAQFHAAYGWLEGRLGFLPRLHQVAGLQELLKVGWAHGLQITEGPLL